MGERCQAASVMLVWYAMLHYDLQIMGEEVPGMHLLITGARLWGCFSFYFFTVGFYTNAADQTEPWSRICGGHD